MRLWSHLCHPDMPVRDGGAERRVPERVLRLEGRAGREQRRRNGAVTRGVKRDVTLVGVTHVQSR